MGYNSIYIWVLRNIRCSNYYTYGDLSNIRKQERQKYIERKYFIQNDY